MNNDDSGLSLVELLVYAAVSALFLGLLALMFVNGIQAQAQTTDRDTATGRASAVSDSILTSIRNASAFTIVGANRALIAKVSTAGGGFECRAWVLTTGGDVRYTTSSSAISTGSTTGWALLVDGDPATGSGATASLARRDGNHLDGSPKFTPIDADGDGLTDAFSRTGQTLSIGLQITLGDADVPVSNGVTAQATTDGTSTTACW
ncbi:hypothetical protein [Microbacterium sp. Root180]|uniref:hypothetical protein n=1 Tax=Microbacterium sp. Root180 TaxID=1736483 RepID=UPI0006FE2D95|nr:hypothetical protein [Microbacterium sp. Root180]KRB37600.1 hypothetical protein ASD93_04440 [Microbacterium sp. Root180]